MGPVLIDPDVDLLEKFKIFLNEKLWVLSSDLKEINQEFRNVNFSLAKIEGKLEGFEKISAQLQGDICILKLQFQASEEKKRNLEKLVCMNRICRI